MRETKLKITRLKLPLGSFPVMQISLFIYGTCYTDDFLIMQL